MGGGGEGGLPSRMIAMTPSVSRQMTAANKTTGTIAINVPMSAAGIEAIQPKPSPNTSQPHSDPNRAMPIH